MSLAEAKANRQKNSTVASSSFPLPKGAIILVAKCPIPGSVKTRLCKIFSDDDAAELAKSMLSDIVETIGSYERFQHVQKLLLYAPGNDDGRQQMSNILQSLNMHKEWTLVPMISDSYDGLTANDLGEKLKDGLLKARHNLQIETSSGGVIGDDYQEAGVVFLGMDSPEVYLDEIEGSLIEAASPARVTHLCPANDGGYGMICLPSSAPASVFDGVRWSDPLTAISQMKALSDCDITNIRIGRLMYDIDEPEDVYGLAGRLCTYFNKSNQDGNEKDWHTSMHAGDALSRPSFAVQISACASTCCKHTWETLLRLKIVKGEKHNFRMSGTIREFLLHKEG